MDNTFVTAYEWFVRGRCPDQRTQKFRELLDFLESVEATPWQYCAFLIWYDEKTPDETVTVLHKTHYVLSKDTMYRFRLWKEERAQTLPHSVMTQIRALEAKRKWGHDPAWIITTKTVDASVMTRLEMACAWKDDMEVLEFDNICKVFYTRAVEMYMSLPLYKLYTPNAWKLIEGLINDRERQS